MKPSKKIWNYMKKGSYSEARKLILNELKAKPDSHWLLTQLSSALYEERKYKEAFQIARKALKEMPDCPLALWHYAGALDMLKRGKEAVKIYQQIINHKPTISEYKTCWEGKRWAEELKNDSRYRLAGVFYKLKKPISGIAELYRYGLNRSRGVKSVYSLKDIKKLFKKLDELPHKVPSSAAINARIGRGNLRYELSRDFESKPQIKIISKKKLMEIPIFHTLQHEWYEMVTEGEKGAYFRSLRQKDKRLNRKYFHKVMKKVSFGLAESKSFGKRISLTAEKLAFACSKIADEIIFFPLESHTFRSFDLRKHQLIQLKRSITVIRALGVHKSFSGGIFTHSVKETAVVYKRLAIMTHYLGGFQVAFISKNGRLAGVICDEGNPHLSFYKISDYSIMKKIFRKTGLKEVDCSKYN